MKESGSHPSCNMYSCTYTNMVSIVTRFSRTLTSIRPCFASDISYSPVAQRRLSKLLSSVSSTNNKFSTNIIAFGNHSIGDREQMKRVAIFDKDGTLTCVNSLWAPWLIDTAKRLEEETELPGLRDEVYRAMGLDLAAYRFVPGGLLSEHTMQACFESIHGLLERRGIPPDRARNLAEEYFVKGYREALQTGNLVGFGNATGVFTQLRHAGFYIAMNTSDSRVIAEGTLERLGVSHLVDAVVCGDDMGITPKPDPYTVLKICAQLDVLPRNAVFIGDTPTDALCGKNSKCGLVITVLSGGIDRRLLEENSDYIVENIDDAVDLILKHFQHDMGPSKVPTDPLGPTCS